MKFNRDTLKNTTFPANPDWLNHIRNQKLQAFINRGLPTRREEAWKYLDLTPLNQIDFETQPFKAPTEYDQIPSNPTQLVFINGQLDPEFSSLAEDLPKELIVLPLSIAINTYRSKIEPFLEEKNLETHPFATLNTAFFSDGFFLLVPAGIHLSKPIHCFHYNQGKGIRNTRNILILEKNAQACFFEHFYGQEDGVYFHNTLTQIHLQTSSLLQLSKTQQESQNSYHISSIHATLNEDSGLSTFHSTLGGQLSRDDLHIHLKGNGSQCQLKGIYKTRQRQNVDHHITVEHIGKHTQSTQHYKGIIQDESRAIFNGKVIVHPHAEKTVAHQSNQNIPLSSFAEVDTRPELEIYNNDVKCTHGATVGSLAQEAIFYLQSRGIPKAQAIQLLIDAFLDELSAPAV